MTLNFFNGISTFMSYLIPNQAKSSLSRYCWETKWSVFHWSRLTPMQYLFFMRHGLHPCIACFSLTRIYIHAILVLHWSQLSPKHCLFSGNHFVDFIYSQMYLVNYICWVHRRSKLYITHVEFLRWGVSQGGLQLHLCYRFNRVFFLLDQLPYQS